MNEQTPIITLRDSTVFDADNAQLLTHKGEHAPGLMSLSQRTEIRQRDEGAWDAIGRRMAKERNPEELAQFWRRIKAANPHNNYDNL